jgi:hypothetical protein
MQILYFDDLHEERRADLDWFEITRILSPVEMQTITLLSVDVDDFPMLEVDVD